MPLAMRFVQRCSEVSTPNFAPNLLALSVMVALSGNTWAGPSGGQVVAGQASINLTGTRTTINQTTSLTTYTTTPFTVPVGFVMQVTPQISDDDTVLINVRPTISRITGFVNDPNPALAILNPPVISRIPEIQSREMESILRIPSGQIAVMGGLMQDGINNNADTVPGAASLPFFGNLFRNRVETTTKSELVIFLRPLVIRDASIEGDYRGMKDLFPTSDFLKNQVGPAKFPATPNTGGR